ncbi:MAG: L,D-transpeptidase [Beijerinckiaceae bacterium]|nr:L,D-transpeptidase [Beijerinckiaceae bacterium]
MPSVTKCILIFCTFFAISSAAQASVDVQVDLSSQRMHVTSGSGETYDWPISSARSGYVTPRGTYRPTSLQTMHYSKKYHHSPMPHSIFFNGGYAIHGTYATGALGRPASHGCIRISPANAAKLYSMIQAEGGAIAISGAPPRSAPFAGAHHHRHAARPLAATPANPAPASEGWPFGHF